MQFSLVSTLLLLNVLYGANAEELDRRYELSDDGELGKYILPSPQPQPQATYTPKPHIYGNTVHTKNGVAQRDVEQDDETSVEKRFEMSDDGQLGKYILSSAQPQATHAHKPHIYGNPIHTKNGVAQRDVEQDDETSVEKRYELSDDGELGKSILPSAQPQATHAVKPHIYHTTYQPKIGVVNRRAESMKMHTNPNTPEDLYDLWGVHNTFVRVTQTAAQVSQPTHHYTEAIEARDVEQDELSADERDVLEARADEPKADWATVRHDNIRPTETARNVARPTPSHIPEIPDYGLHIVSVDQPIMEKRYELSDDSQLGKNILPSSAAAAAPSSQPTAHFAIPKGPHHVVW